MLDIIKAIVTAITAAAPTPEFNNFDITMADTAIDTNAERMAIDDIIDALGSNPWDFGSVNISGGQNDSSVLAMAWHVPAANWAGNTTVENFRFWLSTNGFDDAATVIKYRTWKLDSVSEWVQNATPPLAGEATLAETEPAQNVFQGGDGTTTSITSGDNDTTEAIAAYVYVGASETPGVYEGTDAGNEFRFSFKYDYY
jgi:hypothetical protein